MSEIPAKLAVSTHEHCGVLLEHYSYQPGLVYGYPAHVHPEYQFVVNVNQPGNYIYRGASLNFAAQNLCLLHSGEPHVTGGKRIFAVPTAFLVMYVEPARMQSLAEDVTARSGSAMPYFAAPVIGEQKLVSRYLQLFEAQSPHILPLERDARQLAFFAELLNNHSQNAGETSNVRQDNSMLNRVRDFLHTHFSRSINLDELAVIAERSKFHLCRTFRRQTGMTLHAYQIQLRINLAKKMLLQKLPVSEVAESVGFYDQSHFGKYFKQSVGVTPRNYVSQSI